MKRNLITGAVALAATGVLVTGCSGGASQPAAEGELTWAMWISGQEDQAAWQKVADAVSASDPDITVKIQGAPWNDYWTKISTQLTSSSAPCIVSMQSLRIANYPEALLPIDELAASSGVDLGDFDNAALEGMRVDGELYALPYDTGPILMFYNKDLFAEAGVALPEAGWSVADFEKAGAGFTAMGKKLFAPTVEDLYLESQILAYNGGRVISTDGTLDVGNADFAAGLDWIAGMVNSGDATQASGADSSADDNAFVNGDVATYVDGAFSLLSQKSKVGFELGVTTLPAGSTPATYAAGSGFGISKQCTQPEKAMKAIAVMTGQDVLTDLAAAGRAYPARTAAQSTWFENADMDGVEETFAVAQEGAVPLPGNPAADQLNQLFAQYAIEAINGQTSGADALKAISSQIGQ